MIFKFRLYFDGKNSKICQIRIYRVPLIPVRCIGVRDTPSLIGFSQSYIPVRHPIFLQKFYLKNINGNNLTAFYVTICVCFHYFLAIFLGSIYVGKTDLSSTPLPTGEHKVFWWCCTYLYGHGMFTPSLQNKQKMFTPGQDNIKNIGTPAQHHASLNTLNNPSQSSSGPFSHTDVRSKIVDVAVGCCWQYEESIEMVLLLLM